MGFLWVNGFSFFHCVASPFHSFVTTGAGAPARPLRGHRLQCSTNGTCVLLAATPPARLGICVFRDAAVRWSTWARVHEVAGDRRIVWYGRCAWRRLATLAQQSASLLQPLSTGSHLPVRERVEHSPRPPTRNLQSQYGPFSACACTPQPAQRHTHATHAFDPAHPKPSTSVTQETSARSRHSVSPDVRTTRTSF